MVPMRPVIVLGVVLVLSSLVQAGTLDDPEIRDPVGDTEVEWLDVERVWVEHKDYDVALVKMLLATWVPLPPALATGGLFNGPYYRVDFDLVDWNGTRIGDIEEQYVAVAIEETMVLVYVCVWEHPERGGCWSNGFGQVRGGLITWEVDLKGPEGDAREVGSGYRFEDLSAYTELRTTAHWVPADRAPDVGAAESLSEPTVYTNVRTGGPGDGGGVTGGEAGAVALGLVVVTSVAAGLGRFVYKVGRFGLLRWLLAAFLFSRIQRDEALRHERRAAIFEAVKSAPGTTFSDLRRTLGIGSGSLAFHLKVLEQQGLVAHLRDGPRSRFYLRGPRPEIGDYIGHTQRTVLDAISENPGATPTRLAALVGIPRHAVQYHVGRLLEKGHVTRRRDGRHARYYV